MVATRTVRGTCCFCGGDSVGGCCCVRSCCLGTPCLERSSRSSRSAGESGILPFVANNCHCFPPVPSPDDEILNRNVHFLMQHPRCSAPSISSSSEESNRIPTVLACIHCVAPDCSFSGSRTRYPDNCRQLKFPSILVPCQEEATREPCLQPLRLLPIQLLMPMSLLQLHAAIFSILIATLDSTAGSVIVSSVPSVMSLSVPVSSLSLPRFEVQTS